MLLACLWVMLAFNTFYLGVLHCMLLACLSAAMKPYALSMFVDYALYAFNMLVIIFFTLYAFIMF